MLAAGGHPPVRLHSTPKPLLSVVGRFQPLVAEINETGYMFRRPYVMDSSLTQQTLGLAPTPWDDICRRTAEGN